MCVCHERRWKLEWTNGTTTKKSRKLKKKIENLFIGGKILHEGLTRICTFTAKFYIIHLFTYFSSSINAIVTMERRTPITINANTHTHIHKRIWRRSFQMENGSICGVSLANLLAFHRFSSERKIHFEAYFVLFDLNALMFSILYTNRHNRAYKHMLTYTGNGQK